MLRKPNGYADASDSRTRKKWAPIIAAFMQGDLDRLKSLQRTGTRGRIFMRLVEEIWKLLEQPYRLEPIFYHCSPAPWYIDFVAFHRVKLRTHPFYNPDFLLYDNTWVEATLSENTAYAKFFRYGHQAPRLKVVWLDEDVGFYKSLCSAVAFPNAEALNVATLFPRMSECKGGDLLIQKISLLKSLKGIVL